MILQEITKATNRITGDEMLLAKDCDGRFYLIINGINQKAGNENVVRKYFEHLSK